MCDVMFKPCTYQHNVIKLRRNRNQIINFKFPSKLNVRGHQNGGAISFAAIRIMIKYLWIIPRDESQTCNHMAKTTT